MAERRIGVQRMVDEGDPGGGGSGGGGGSLDWRDQLVRIIS